MFLQLRVSFLPVRPVQYSFILSMLNFILLHKILTFALKPIYGNINIIFICVITILRLDIICRMNYQKNAEVYFQQHYFSSEICH
jgi:hypothetical protein